MRLKSSELKTAFPDYKPVGWTDELEGFEKFAHWSQDSILDDTNHPHSKEFAEFCRSVGVGSKEYKAFFKAWDKRNKLRDKALRNAWSTGRPILALASFLLGRPFDSDPFYNPYGDVADFMRDGEVFVATGQNLEDPEDNGHTCEVGETIWKNGPFSAVEPWAKKSAQEGKAGKRVAMATPCSPGLGWFRKHVWSANLVCFIGREKFTPPPGIKASTPNGSTILSLWANDMPWPREPFMLHDVPGFKNPIPCVPGIRS